ncbi:aminomethyl-transferring glycine dehydrogenase subunit GcvPA [Virgibacillus halodenitrificans]|uniref:aminomethyl-transferring glycine dehydrogenase subunit GcvPA n=1 Tax=Virgibacillus halodenitrificans TaxID=1482 RepID=UPI001369CD0B|nr:aminomethyl-transferring glycine dehydrogenase subunit GcvPA [Virgibacillus halodenitrificans]MYL47190.1 aminomethyl-transferring glycine dehydrogenase subunit GcvPA [Virgibacillus halodenitrificans]
MEFRYLPMTEIDKQEMLNTIGIRSTDELFSDIPSQLRMQQELNLKKPANEADLMKELSKMAGRNANLKEYSSFLGAGVYDHFIPSVVDHIISRSEFYTAYTPYQPEISQGELQAIFEFQTMISELTGMAVANSSMYDGGTALAEAVNLSAAQTKKKKILVSKAVHPESRAVIESYAKGPNLEIVEIDFENGVTDLAQLEKELDENTASVVLQYPNFFGQIEPLEKVKELISTQKKTMFIVSSNPLALGYLTPPGDFGADIVVGDTQVFGIPAQYGGPHCGYFATTEKLMRKVPGRLVGQTVDEDGVRGFVLTLQAREQHIRRDKATSNICSNQALNALASSVAMSSIGKHGLRKMAVMNMQKARYAKELLKKAKIPVVNNGAYFNEIVIKLDKSVSEVNTGLLEKKIIGGYDLEQAYPELQGHMLIAVTEIRTKEEIETFVKELGDING